MDVCPCGSFLGSNGAHSDQRRGVPFRKVWKSVRGISTQGTVENDTVYFLEGMSILCDFLLKKRRLYRGGHIIQMIT